MNNFTINSTKISNHMLYDKKLSATAKGTYMMLAQNFVAAEVFDFTFARENIVKKCNSGYRALTNSIHELISKGYLRFTSCKNQQTEQFEYEYILYDKPSKDAGKFEATKIFKNRYFLDTSYTHIPNDVINSSELTLSEKGIYGLIGLMRSNDTNVSCISVSKILSCMRSGVTIYKTAISNLKRLGFIRHVQTRAQRVFEYHFELFTEISYASTQMIKRTILTKKQPKKRKYNVLADDKKIIKQKIKDIKQKIKHLEHYHGPCKKLIIKAIGNLVYQKSIKANHQSIDIDTVLDVFLKVSDEDLIHIEHVVQTMENAPNQYYIYAILYNSITNKQPVVQAEDWELDILNRRR